VGCIEINNDTTKAPESDNQAQVRLKDAQSRAEFKNYLITPFTQLSADPVYSILESDLATTDATSQPVADEAAASDGAEFSGTNNQVAGVDEADIWKYDGSNFFVLKQAVWDYHYNNAISTDCYGDPEVDALQSERSSPELIPCYPDPTQLSPAQIRIVKNDQSTLATVDLDNINPNALYLKDDALVVLGNRTHYGNDWSNYQTWQDGQTDIRMLNVTDKSQPQQTLQINIDGYVVQSRRIGDEIFLVTRFSPTIEGLHTYPTNQAEVDQNQVLLNSVPLNDLLPKISINDQSQALVNGEDCLLADVPEYQYTYPTIATITRININSGEFSSRCMAGQVDGIYMSENSLYLFNTSYWDFSEDEESSDIVWNWGQGNTHLHKFEIQSFDYQGSVILQGRLGWNSPSYRLGELNDGNLGVITSENSWSNPIHHLTVLGESNDQLSALAQLPNEDFPAAIGKPGERIYSVRFMQDRAYIVTFRNTDPLYVIDLSNSTQPNIAGELEIPGFSDYLHPIGSDLLLGVGQSESRAVKVSLFNVSDIHNPSELGNEIIGAAGSNTLLSYQPHAFSGIQQEEQYRFTLPINVTDTNYHWLHSGLYLFDVTDNHLNQAGAMITNTRDDDNGYQYNNDWSMRRGLIQGNDVYHLKGSDIYHANWHSPEQMSSQF
jgi:uncharacterized secreted protein with C-terminal beta-propeller domain